MLWVYVLAAFCAAAVVEEQSKKAYRKWKSQKKSEDESPPRELTGLELVNLEIREMEKWSPPDKEIIEKAWEMSRAIRAIVIFAREKKVVDGVSKVNSYYVPAAIKILADYNSLKRSCPSVDVSVKESVIKGIETLTGVFEQTMSGLMQAEVADLKTDVRTLEVVSAVDGFSKDVVVTTITDNGLRRPIVKTIAEEAACSMP